MFSQSDMFQCLEMYKNKADGTRINVSWSILPVAEQRKSLIFEKKQLTVHCFQLATVYMYTVQ